LYSLILPFEIRDERVKYRGISSEEECLIVRDEWLNSTHWSKMKGPDAISFLIARSTSL
jgi:hypothetical protein